jgi:Arc/MetJ family transcription regulator
VLKSKRYEMVKDGHVIFRVDNKEMCMQNEHHTHYVDGGPMRTNIVIDDDLMNEAMTLSRLQTKKSVVETGLRLLIQIKKQERIRGLRGKLTWDGDLDAMRSDH